MSIINRSYPAQPIPGVNISKGNGKTRLVSIPTVTDRWLQQGVTEVITPLFESKDAATVSDPTRTSPMMGSITKPEAVCYISSTHFYFGFQSMDFFVYSVGMDSIGSSTSILCCLRPITRT